MAGDPLQEWEPKRFFHGAVIRVRLVNFMTYAACEFFPGPRLNLVIGANGSGKSTIVCALALGLGGNTNVLQRAQTLEGFIKNGETEALIEIELFRKGDKSAVVRRKLVKGEKNNMYELDGKAMSEGPFKSVMKEEYSIQVDNLCQFLPQDKVSYFSKLTEKQLLEETIRAGLGQKKVDEQATLAQLQAELREMGSVEAAQRKELEEKEARLEKMEKEVQVLQEREEKEKQAKDTEDMIAYLDFATHREEYAAKKKSIKGVKEELNELKSEVARVREEGKRNASTLNRLKSDHTEQRTRMRQLGPQAKKVEDAQKLLHTEVDDNVSSIAAWQEQQDKRKTERKALVEQVETTALGLESFEKDNGSREDLDARCKALERRNQELSAEVRERGRAYEEAEQELKRKGNEVEQQRRAMDRLEQQRKAKGRRVEYLKSYLKAQTTSQARDVAAWREGGQLKGDVYLILNEIDAPDEQTAVYFERAVTQRQLCTFVTTNRADSSFLMRQKGFTVVNVEQTQERRNRLDASLMDQLHLRYIDELVEAPPAVLQALRSIAGFGNVLVGTGDTDKELARLDDRSIEQLNKLRVQTPGTEYSFNKSRYSRGGTSNLITNTKSFDPNKRPDLLKGQSASEVAREMATLKEKEAALKEEAAELERKAKKHAAGLEEAKQKKHECAKEFDDASKLCTAGRRLARQVQLARTALEQLDQAGDEDQVGVLRNSVAAFRGNIAKAIKNANRLVKAGNEMLDYQANLIPLSGAMAYANALHGMQARRLEDAERVLQEREVAHEATLQEVERLKNKTKELLKVYKARDADETALEEKLANFDEQDRENGTTTSNRQRMGELTTVLKLLRHQLQGGTADRSVVERYKTLKEEVKALRPRVHNQQETRTKKQEDFDARREKWTREVRDLMCTIDTTFRAAFQGVQRQGYHCAGEVELLTHERITELGVGIKVRFRKEHELQRLDQHTQSGGERSLTTFMYLLSLNEVSRVPFRVVDEINQGMDEEKERISFYQLVNSSCGDHEEVRAQYFLITPKLLRGLKYHPDITVHVVFNGYGALPQNIFDFRDFVRRAQEAKATSSKRRRSNSSGPRKAIKSH